MTIAPFVCIYTGPPGECCECGGYDPTGSGLCSFECVESRQARELHGEKLSIAAKQQRIENRGRRR